MTGPAAIILELDPQDFAVAAWVRDERGMPVYRIVEREIQAASVAATVARAQVEQKGASRA